MCLNLTDHVFKPSFLHLHCKIDYKNEVDHLFEPHLLVVVIIGSSSSSSNSSRRS